jgi:hypothetical protein
MVCQSCISNKSVNTYYNNNSNKILNIKQFNTNIYLLKLCEYCKNNKIRLIKKQTDDCFEKVPLYNIFINRLPYQFTNPDLLVPDIFRRCQYGKNVCSTYKGSTQNYFRLPKLIDDNIIKYLLFNGVNTPIVDYTQHNHLNCKELNNIINFIYPDFNISPRFDIDNFYNIYNNTLLFKLLKFISISNKSYNYVLSGKNTCSYIIDYPATLTCLYDKTCNTQYNLRPVSSDNLLNLNMDTLYLIYKYCILNYNTRNLNNLKIDNKLSYIFLITINVFKDLILVYSNLKQKKCICNPTYNILTPEIKDHISSYIVFKKSSCI